MYAANNTYADQPMPIRSRFAPVLFACVERRSSHDKAHLQYQYTFILCLSHVKVSRHQALIRLISV